MGVMAHTELFTPFADGIVKDINNFSGSIVGRRDLLIDVDVEFPIDQHNARREFRKFLDAVAKSHQSNSSKYHQIVDGFGCEITEHRVSANPKFSLLGFGSGNSSGYVVMSAITEIQYALEKKRDRLLQFTGQYDEAWLIVGLGSSFGLGLEDKDAVATGLAKDKDWAGVIILNLANSNHSIEIRF